MTSWKQEHRFSEKLRRSPKKPQIHKNKQILGRSIEERPASVNDRKEFGHW
jgi:transposase, IS30 family